MKLLDRNQSIINLCTGKEVLHLGCIGYTDLPKDTRLSLLSKTLHAQIHKAASKQIGLDYSKDVIKEVKDVEGFETVFYANAEKLDELEMNQKFDIIVVGDLIEHLSNPGLMLDGLTRFCHSKTDIILTTPNAFGIASILKYSVNRFREGREHVMSFNRLNLVNLIERHGYQIEQIDTCFQEHAKTKTFFPVLRFLLSLFPKFGGTLFVILKKTT